MPTCANCNSYFPNRMRIDGVYRHLATRKFCLNCSPYKQRGAFNLLKPSKTAKNCPRCERENLPLTEFYVRSRKAHDPYTYCKSCAKKRAAERVQEIKRQAIEYKGGHCQICNYDRRPAALHFHHLDPNIKEFEISRIRSRHLNSMREELDKCILICSNCHAELHTGLIKLPTFPVSQQP